MAENCPRWDVGTCTLGEPLPCSWGKDDFWNCNVYRAFPPSPEERQRATPFSEAHIFIEDGGTAQLAAKILQAMQPGCFFWPDPPRFFVHGALGSSWPAKEGAPNIARRTLVEFGVHPTPVDFSQTGTAYGKNFCVIYLLEASAFTPMPSTLEAAPQAGGATACGVAGRSSSTPKWWQFWR